MLRFKKGFREDEHLKESSLPQIERVRMQAEPPPQVYDLTTVDIFDAAYPPKKERSAITGIEIMTTTQKEEPERHQEAEFNFEADGRDKIARI